MAALELLLLLLAVSCALQLAARKIGLPHPVLLVVGGGLLALLPGLPRVAINPELLFLVFIPPLLYVAAFRTSLRELTAELWPIVRLGVLLVLITIAAVAATAHGMTGALGWGAAFVLAAIVAPPDPVAATAVMRPLRAPPRLVSILEGEGLVNDATALVAYRIAIAATLTGAFSIGAASLRLLLTGAGGVLAGLVIGWLIVHVRRGFMRDVPVVDNMLSLLTPFAAYLPADRAGASGVLAVVAAGLYVGRQTQRFGSAATRVQGEALWSMVTFGLESLVFILVGLELPSASRVLREHTLSHVLWTTLAISGVLIAVRMLWVWPSAYLPRLGRDSEKPSWRWVLFIGWAGMRGGDSLVIALALPLAFPERNLIIFVTFGAIFATLVLQGLTVRPLLKLLGLQEREPSDEKEEAHARRVIAEAGLRKLDELAKQDGATPDGVEYLRERESRRLERWAALDREAHGHDHLPATDTRRTEQRSSSTRTLRTAMLEAERDALVRMRDEETISDDVMRRILRDLDLETMMLEADEDDAPQSPYEAV
jgi:CPA1 family monovalent cation:H+ antiporter